MINEKSTIEYINEAIHQLCPGSQFSIIGDSLEKDDEGGLVCVRWNHGNKYPEPKAEEVLDKIKELKSEWAASEYKRKRAPEYPSIGEQLDALFKAGLFPEEMAAKIQAIKDKYPKPE